MSRYIDAIQLENKLIEHKKDEHSNLNKCGYDTWKNAFKIALRELHNTPTANVEEIVRGEWILNCISQKLLEDYDEEYDVECSLCHYDEEYYVECSLCHRTEFVPFELEEEKMLDYAKRHFPFCHCGADMRGEQ